MAAPKGTARLMSELKSRIMTPATTSHYEVFFQAPGKIESDIKSSGRYNLALSSDDKILINLSCSDTTLPGSSFMTHEATNDRAGVTEQHVYRRSYDNEMDFTFMVDRNYIILRYFEAWMASITNEDKFDFDPTVKASRYIVKFPKDYQADYISITKFEKDVDRPDEQTQLRHTLIGAYPKAINSVPVSYDQSDLLKVTVTMSFIRYHIQSLGSASPQKFDPLVNAQIVGQSQIGPNQTRTEFLLPNGDIAVQVSSYGSSVTTYPDSVEPGDFT
jgi:hypothetical protein